MFKEMFTESVNEKYTGRQKALKRQNKSGNTGDVLGTSAGKQASRDKAADLVAREKMDNEYSFPIMRLFFKLMDSQGKRNPLITDEGWELNGGDDMPEAGYYSVVDGEYAGEVRLDFDGPTGYDRGPDVEIVVRGPNGVVYSDLIKSNIAPKDLFKKAKKSLIKANGIFTEASEEVLLSGTPGGR